MTASAQLDVDTVSIDPHTRMGTVRLTVSDLARSVAFYERVLALPAHEVETGAVAFGPDPNEPLVELHGDQSAHRLDRRATGLYHLAILVPSRRDLAEALARVAVARWPLDGASDHLVSEALYLSDPGGNGIELYRDRPREQWRFSGDRLEMATLPLDLEDLLGELSDPERLPDSMPSGTRIGHVHLQVADLASSEAFYSAVLGLDVMVRGYPGALFVSAGGYHHHLGLNTWHSAGGSPPPPGSVGLRSFDVVLPDAEALERVRTRAQNAGLGIDDSSAHRSSFTIRDPSGNVVRLRRDAQP